MSTTTDTFRGRPGAPTRRPRRGLLAVVVAALLAPLLPAAAVGAATTTGGLVAFGADAEGQVGDPGTGLLAGRFRDVAAGGAHSLGVTEAGAVVAWGDNARGQLGTRPTLLGSSGSPRVVPGVPAAVAVAAGRAHSLALTADGRVFAWGDNSQAQLTIDPGTLAGLDLETLLGAPRQVQGLPAADPVVAVAAGDDHSLALTRAGVLYAWGANDRGQAGSGGFLGLDDDPLPIVIQPAVQRFGPEGPSTATIVAVGAGADHTVAVDATGLSWGFGDDAAGQLGGPGGPTSVRRSPSPITDATGTPVTDVVDAAGTATTSLLVLRDGGVLVVGDGAPTAPVVGLPGPVTAAAGGAAHALVVVDTTVDVDGDGDLADEVRRAAEVWSFGEAADGRLGHGGAAPARASAVTDTAVAIAAGGAHSLATVAPRVSVSAMELDLGSAEVTLPAAPVTLTVTNEGPVAATVAPVVAASAELAVDDADCAAALAPGDSCDVVVVFTPRFVGPFTDSLVVDHDGFDPAFTVAVRGTGLTLAGQISIGSSVATDPGALVPRVAASPRIVSLADVPIQPYSPASQASLETAGPTLPLGDLSVIGPTLPLGDLSVIGPTLPLGDLSVIGPTLPLGDLSVIGQPVVAALEQVNLAELVLVEPFVWSRPGATPFDPAAFAADPTVADGETLSLLAGTALEDRPLQLVSLADVLRDDVARDRWAALPTAYVRFDVSTIGRVSLLSYLLGTLPLTSFGGADRFAADVRDLGRPGTEADGLTSSAFELQLAGVQATDLVELFDVTLGEIAAAEASGAGRSVVTQFFLDPLPLFQSQLGTLPCLAAVCDGGASRSLYEAQLAGTLRADAQIGDLVGAYGPDAVDPAEIPLGLLLFGLLPTDRLPFELYGLDALLAKHIDNATSSVVDYAITFDNTPPEGQAATALPGGAVVEVALPPTFAYVPRSATYLVDGSEVPVEVESARYLGVEGPFDGPGPDRLTFAVPDEVAVPGGSVLELRFQARPGLTLGIATIDEVSITTPAGEPIRSAVPAAPVQVVDAEQVLGGPSTAPVNERGDDLPGLATPLAVGDPIGGVVADLALGHLDRADDVDWYRLDGDLGAGQELQVILGHQTDGDADVFVFGPADAVGEAPVRPASPLAPLTLTRDPGLGLDAPSAEIESDVALAERPLPVEVDGLVLLGVSQQRGTTGERLSVLLPERPSGGDLLVLVRGYNGSVSDTPYSLRTRLIRQATSIDVAPRPAVTDPIAPLVADQVVQSGDPSTAGTLFLTAPGRTADDPAVDLLGALADPGLAALIGSVAVLAVDQDPAVAGALAAMDADPGDLRLENDVVRAVNAVVDRERGANVPGYVVVVGGTDVLPMANVFDRTITVNQRPFAYELAALTDPDAAGNSAIAAPLLNRVLTDDGYFSLAPRRVVGLDHLYVPDVTGSRLVETEAEIVGTIEQFRSYDGIADLDTAVVSSSADFLDDLAADLAAELGEGLPTTTIVDDEQDWGADGAATLLAAVDGAASALAPQGHSNPVLQETAGAEVDVVTAEELLANVAQTVLFSVGCHLALPLPDSIVRTTVPTEFSQAAARSEVGSLTGKVAYGVGTGSLVAYDEELLVRYAAAIDETDLGGALRAAKRRYLDGAGTIDVVDLKVVQSMTHFGLPHLRLAGVPAPGPVTEPTAAPGPDGVVPLEVSAELTRVETPTGSYFTNRGETIQAPFQPVVPSVTVPVAPAGNVATGIILERAVSFEAAGLGADGQPDPAVDFVPHIAVPARTGDAGDQRAVPTVGDAQFPGNLTAAVGRDLRLALGSHRTGDGPERFATHTLFAQLGGRAFHAGVPDTGLEFESFDVFVGADGAVTFLASLRDAVDDGAPGLDEVVVLYQVIGDDLTPDPVWRAVTLTPAPGSPYDLSAGVSVPGVGDVRALAQARDGNQVVTFMNKGRFTRSIEVRPQDGAPVQVQVTGVGAPSNPGGADPQGWFERARVSAAAAPGQPILYRLNNGRPTLYQGPVELTEDRFHVLRFGTGQAFGPPVVVRVDNGDPTIAVGVAPRVLLGDPDAGSFACADAVSGIAPGGCVGSVTRDGDPGAEVVPLAPGQPVPTDRPGTFTLQVRATDVAGQRATVVRKYNVGYEFSGFLQPVENRPATNAQWEAGQTIPVKWQLRQDDGSLVGDPDAVVGVGYADAEGCVDDAGNPVPPGSVPTNADGDLTDGLVVEDGTYRVNWRTPRQLQGCYEFRISLDDGSTYSALFRFD